MTQKRIFTIHWFAVLLLLTAALPDFLQAQAELPGTAAGKRGAEIVNLINSGTDEQAAQYVSANYAPGFRDAFPLDRHTGLFSMLRQRHQAFEVEKIEESEPFHVALQLFSKTSGARIALLIWVEEKEPYLISRMGVQPVAASANEPVNQPQPAAGTGRPEPAKKLMAMVSQEELNQFLDQLLDELVAKDEFSGTVLVAKNGKPLYQKAVGYADKGLKVANQIDTKFNLGSMNKMFTGTAIMQLLQQGKLKLDDKVGKFLPDYPNPDVRDKVTIHHLLTHTSGMGLYWQEYFQSPKMAEIQSVADYDKLANRNPLQFAPGEKFFYSNCGPLVLGLIIEKISGMSYYDYVRKFIYEPAAMPNSDCYDISTVVENLAVGYTKGAPMGRSFKEWHNNLGSHPRKGGPAGGGYSTVEDLLNFDIALRSGKLLSAENFKLMTSGKVARNGQTQYAYLFQEKFVNGHRIIGHNGGAGGINSHLAMYMDLGWTVAIMANYEPPAAEKIAGKLEELLTRQ